MVTNLPPPKPKSGFIVEPAQDRSEVVKLIFIFFISTSEIYTMEYCLLFWYIWYIYYFCATMTTQGCTNRTPTLDLHQLLQYREMFTVDIGADRTAGADSNADW